MKIGIIGAGQIGSALIKQYIKAGHEVKMTNASGIEKLKGLEIESGAKAVSLNEVVKDVDVLVISIAFLEIPNRFEYFSIREKPTFSPKRIISRKT